MPFLTVANVVFAHGEKRVLNGVNLTLDRGDKVGLVGRNGCGKSTLMRIISGLNSPDSGQVQFQRGTRVGYLTQNPDLDPDRTLRKEAERAFAELAELHEQLELTAEKMGAASDDEELDKLMKRYDRLEQAIQAAGGYAIDHKIDATLHGLGLADQFFDVQVKNLSGGQKARLALAKLLLEQPDLLLLDEPTNHLDIAGREWLEEFLKGYPGAVLLISHDRWLLDQVVDKIEEMELGKLVEYPGNYAAFREQRALRMLDHQRALDKQQTYIRSEQQFIDRYKAGQRAKQARGRETRLERFKETMELGQIIEQGVMNFTLPPAPRSGDMVVNTESVSKVYDNKPLFQDLSITIKRGDRIGIIGPNGAGKTTLVRTIIGESDPDEGSVRIGSNVSVGHFNQTHDHLNPDDTPISYLARQLGAEVEQSARDLAGAFLFSGLEQEKPLGVLSGGECARVILAGLMGGNHNLLILDEPSNHLDIPSAERLEEAIAKFDGTLILISHDRMLLQDTVDQLLILDGEGNIRHMLGSYRDYVEGLAAKKQAAIEQREAAEAAEQERKRRERAEQKAKEKKAAAKSKSGKGKKKGGKRSSPFGGMSIERLEQKIEEIETKLAKLDERLADPDLYKQREEFDKVHRERMELADSLKPLEQEWERRAEES